MNPKQNSLSFFVANIALAIAKLVLGILSHSVALLAESLHSVLNASSSFIAFLGIYAAEKPADKNHPYGHERYDSFGGLLVVTIFSSVGCWILVDALKSLISGHTQAEFSIYNIGLMVFALLFNLFLSIITDKKHKHSSSLSFEAHNKHTRIDIIASFAVIIGLFVTKYYSMTDSILAILVSLYIFYEAYFLGKHVFDSLLDKSNPSLEAKIRRHLKAKDAPFDELKTRQVGQTNVAEVSLLFDPKSKIEEVSDKIERIEEELVESIDELKDVSVSIKSLESTEHKK